MKSVLISIRPEWCEKIANGIKTLEIRKTRPKIDTPFKCFIYCTNKEPLWKKDDWVFTNKHYNRLLDTFDYMLNGKVIGEFICDCITFGDLLKLKGDFIEYIKERSCLTDEELERYSQGKETYHWHISNLIIYDKPKVLGYDCKFITNKSVLSFDSNGEYCYTALKRPPQSWCYVEMDGEKQ